MPIFRYRALTEMGKKIGGMIDADSYELAKEKLRREKILVTELSTAKSKKEVVLNAQILLAFTRELAQLLKAGLPLYESLLTIEEKYRKHRAHSLFLDLCDQLKGGSQFSQALKAYPKSFDAIYISIVRAGENTGALPWAFQQLYELTERRQKLKKQLVSAMAYPTFLGIFCFLVVLGLLLFVIPSMQELFEGRRLHPLTQLVLSISQFLQHSYFLIFSTTGTFALGAVYFFRQPAGKMLLQHFLQRIPLMKTILTQAALIRFCRSTAILLYGGIPLTMALGISRKVMKHALMEQAIERAERRIIEGVSLSVELKKSSHIPPLVPRMLATAEETGKLPEMFQSISDIYDQELERSLTHITTFLQPALLIVLGGVIGLIVLSILLPLTDVSSLITS